MPQAKKDITDKVLTAKQSKLVEYYVFGCELQDVSDLINEEVEFSLCIGNKTKAYEASYGTGTSNPSINGSVSFRRANVRRYLREMIDLRNEIAKKRLLQVDYHLNRILGESIETGDHFTQLKVLDMVNKTEGKYVQKIEADTKSEIVIRVENAEDNIMDEI